MNGRSVKVTQIAFPEAVNNTVHASGAYASRGSNPMSNASDGIFADSLSSELITPTGDTANGYRGDVPGRDSGVGSTGQGTIGLGAWRAQGRSAPCSRECRVPGTEAL